MTPLRQRFIEDMHLRGLASTTQRSYLHYVTGFAKFYNTSPDRLDLEAVRQYQLYLMHEKKLSPESVNTFLSAVQFLYLVTLEMPWGKEDFPRVRRAIKLPVVLSQEEVLQFFEHVGCLKNRAALMLCYGAGLRISEAVAVRVSDIDSKRMLIRVVQGKGKKDRYAMLSKRLLSVLRSYWRAARPKDYLFPTWRQGRHMTSSALAIACRNARVIQVLLGHSRIETTARYTAVSPNALAKTISPLDRLTLPPQRQSKK
jgi:integrase/recombinase XerD